eukprot:CAMPEP_0175804884 /NCGR_PEP_ID=MMETSP0107_2-20121207/363_1 /TAXON_ID=195067 ORGANISM="Goniomonas pacifica, Strain CCMP1869" /NCGR_SAMPLE_ID=MMETSP0107_2 /ASSEMBLY_ACC=CAM_ASM_000203 /LENGTH=35 /DNA_ID= /DNA_START= /DNA_END= /DNA_ORIENTATION=
MAENCSDSWRVVVVGDYGGLVPQAEQQTLLAPAAV